MTAARLAVLLLLGLVLAPAALSQEGTITAPPALWRGYDPRALPLEPEILRTWREGDCVYEKLTFTGEEVGGRKTRIFALRGAPVEGKRRPGILHVHGGGQTASQEWVRYWATRGYVAVSFDFCGPLPGRTEFTDWGPITHANMMQAAGGFQVRPTPRESSWYHWAVASRRALTLLEVDPRVDPKRLGIFGISVGGTLCWLVAGSDPRVRTAVPIYGCGYNYDDRNLRWGFGELSPDLKVYKQVLSPEAHAPYVRCPVLFLNATNDFHGPMDYSFDTLRAAKGPVRQAYSPRYNHHLEPEQGRNLAHWMEWQLRGSTAFPATPVVRIALDANGVPEAVVRPDRSRDVARVDVYYALRDRMPQARFWRRVEPERVRKEWRASIPVRDAWDPELVFANVLYRSGVSLSSNLAREIPGQLGAARATLAWSPALEHGRDGLEGWYYTAAYTDPNVEWPILRIEPDGEGGRCLGFVSERFGDPLEFTISTHQVNDPQWEGRPGASLAFDYRGDYETLTVNLVCNDWRPQSKTYSAVVSPGSGVGWQTAVLPQPLFRAADGEALPKWQAVERIEIRGKARRTKPPGLRRFRWEGG